MTTLEILVKHSAFLLEKKNHSFFFMKMTTDQHEQIL